MELREIHVQASGTGGPQHLSIFVLFDPASGAFSWRAQATEEAPKIPSEGTANFNDDHAAFLKDGEIVDFWALMFRMYIRDCRGIASSMDDAEAKALKAVAQSIDSQEDILGNGQDLFAVSLAAISNDFLYRPMTANPSISVPKITDVKWDVNAQHWTVTLQARWAAVITLDGSYNVLSIKKVG